VRRDRVKQLASLLDDLDASAKSSRIRTTELLNANRSHSPSPPSSPHPSKRVAGAELASVHVESDSEREEEELLSDLDEMINQVPSDEDPDPHHRIILSPPAAAQSTPYHHGRREQKSVLLDLFVGGPREEISPVRGLKSAQKTTTPASNLKTPAKQVDFKDPGVYKRPFLSPATCLYLSVDCVFSLFEERRIKLLDM
jgi:hypothetical protein